MGTTEPLELSVLLETPERRENKDPLGPLASRVSLVLLAPSVRLARLETEVSQETREPQDLVVQRGSVVTPDLPALLELRDPSVPVDLLVLLAPMVARESLALSELPVPSDTRARVECPVSAVQPVPPEARARRVRLDTEAWRATWGEMAPVVPPDLVAPLDLVVPTVTRVSLAPSVLPALLVHAVPLGSAVSLAQLDLLASPGPLVLRDRLEPEESEDQLEGRETSALPDLLDPPDSLDPLALLDPLDPLVLVVTRVLPVSLVSLVLLAELVPPVLLVLLAPLARLAPPVRTVHGDFAVTPVPLGRRENRAWLAPPAWLETRDPPERADPLVLLEPPDPKASSVPRDSTACLAPEETEVCPEVPELPERLVDSDPLVPLALAAPLVTSACLA